MCICLHCWDPFSYTVPVKLLATWGRKNVQNVLIIPDSWHHWVFLHVCLYSLSSAEVKLVVMKAQENKIVLISTLVSSLNSQQYNNIEG